MTQNDRRRIGALVVKIQEAFLESPALCLTLKEAQRRFAVGRATCEAVLMLLVESGVLRTTPQGRFARLFPRTPGRVAA